MEDIAKPAGGVVALSLALGLSRGAVSQWEKVPEKHLEKVEQLTGYPRHQLRPDIYKGYIPIADGEAA